MTGCENELTEIFVFGEQDSVLFEGEVDNDRIVGAGSMLTHGDYVVTYTAESINDPGVAALVCEKAHDLGRVLSSIVD